MKRQKLWLFMCLPIALSGITDCTNTPPPETITRFEGEACENDEQCSSGLVCESKLCRKTCAGDSDCNQNQECLESRCVPRSGSTQTQNLPEGSSCDDTHTCASNLVCINALCSKVDCQNDADCQDENKECKNYKCVAKVVTDSPKVPQGGMLTPMATTISGGTLKVQILNGPVHKYENGSQKVQINEAAWK